MLNYGDAAGEFRSGHRLRMAPYGGILTLYYPT